MQCKITDLPRGELTSDTIDNCFYVEELGTHDLKSVSMKNVFDWIREKAVAEGLTIELQDNRILLKEGNVNEYTSKLIRILRNPNTNNDSLTCNQLTMLGELYRGTLVENRYTEDYNQDLSILIGKGFVLDGLITTEGINFLRKDWRFNEAY